MNRLTITCIALFLVIGSVFLWAQHKIMDARRHIRVEEKILMLSDRPEVTRIAALGFDNAVADLLWIRAIQYFGGNFSTLDEDLKKEGMSKLLENLVGLDPEFIGAWKFGGFVINEAMHDPEEAMTFLLRGGSINPEAWRLTFDAGFLAFYQLKDFQVAKQLFTQAAYGPNMISDAQLDATGLMGGFDLEAVRDGDPASDIALEPGTGSLTFVFPEKRKLGRIALNLGAGGEEQYSLFAGEGKTASTPYKKNLSARGTDVHVIDPAINVQSFGLAELKPAAEDQPFVISEVELFGPRTEAPTYVDRMAIEMDRAGGRFSAAWNQFIRYREEAIDKGDTIGLEIADAKLKSIYNDKCHELITEAAELFIEANNGELPSATMTEVVEQGYLEQVVMKHITEDPNFQSEVLPVLAPSGNLYEIMRTWDNKYPHLLIKPDDQQDWFIISRLELIERQKKQIERLNQFVAQFKEEHGSLPASLNDLKSESWFVGQEKLLEDSLKGELYLNQATGLVESRNPQI
ncbi:MAG: hypothetical protein P9L94_07705 [Candidatus Hinthialibacter antarcticus]|nr:hypothetical protein [Candidatus Hinthialibacter antarcticus]